ncbi:hypothetical protein DPMN_139417 [Dreissena polymorpha]|uniref:Uncharacterized protein n=1 Tax=Dreissena polymorpha TaxID=45954 RepID=A0A9D4G692_DREPO|nr:hypothetical protein DPMN_139417 [Dreissena polymorpha]
MLNYTSFTRESIEIEIDRYITLPGQETAYKIGELKIRELRALTEQELGNCVVDFKGKDYQQQYTCKTALLVLNSFPEKIVIL